ncbi:MAG: ATP-binding protein, partial [Nitrospinota bacterium]|nr:ATP-binding protein [Nitrospinota bacterium]
WEMVFTEFYRRKGPGGESSGGNGLGLAICRRIMAEHGGAIRIATSGPEGTTFELIFPR